MPSLFGLAPGGVCRAGFVAGAAVRSYRTLSLSRLRRFLGRSPARPAFCCTFPGVAPAGHYPAPPFRGARTFLLPPKRDAAARPSDKYNLIIPLRFGKKQSEQDRAALAIYHSVDHLGPIASLESQDRCDTVGHIVTEALEREQETCIRP